MYREASEGILKMAAAELSVEDWHSDANATLRKRLKVYQACTCQFPFQDCWSFLHNYCLMLTWPIR